MKSSAIIFLIVAFLASIAFSVPTNYERGYCSEDVDILNFERPKEGAIYKINSTQIVEFKKLKDCYGEDVNVTFEIFSIGKQNIVDTIVEQENLSKLPYNIKFLIDKVWANDGAKYFVTSTIFTKGHTVFGGKSGTFTTVNSVDEK